MVNLVGDRAVGPPRHKRTTNVRNDRVGPVVVERRTAHAGRSVGDTRVTPLHGPYRKNHRDYSYVRVVAASAIIVILVLIFILNLLALIVRARLSRHIQW